MDSLIVHPTDISQWYTIVTEAQANTNIVLSQDTESYLVFLLLRSSNDPSLIDSIISIDFLNAMQAHGKLKIERLKEVGDKSLLVSGMFPEMAQKRHVSLDYFMELGQSAYFIISNLEVAQTRDLYLELGNKFLALQKILNAVAHVS